ncbi:testicular haploid expressed gene protein isoform X3 [Mustela putorius furo]|uniref:Testicular haploid expressed gene protein isoform X3 n=1 Tax=Mustela putorius furo TaxID=9669 RepID=A0A8U0NLU1_MUSPF|nr:testicular haploid expressed gene protein isoform X3 [Mustela putorius furo]
MWTAGMRRPFSCRRVTTDTLGCLGSKAVGRQRTQCMGDPRQSSLNHHHSSEAEGGPHRGQYNGVLGTGAQDMVSGSRRATDAGKLRFEDQEEEALPEEATGGEVPSPQKQDVALVPLDGGPEKDLDEGISEMSRLSTSQKFPSISSIGGRKRRRLLELAKPKTNWQVLKDRMGCCCKGYAWVSPCKRNLQFCVYWPSVYWTERFLEDTTLTITVPEVSRRVEELARPKRFYSEYYNNNRITPIWPIPRSSLEHHASSRLRELAAPRIRNNIWSINMSESSPPRLRTTVSGPRSHVFPFPGCLRRVRFSSISAAMPLGHCWVTGGTAQPLKDAGVVSRFWVLRIRLLRSRHLVVVLICTKYVDGVFHMAVS